MIAFGSLLSIVTVLSLPTIGIGFVVGRLHIRRLAWKGGEDRYPAVVADAVEAYRRDNHIEELRGYDDG